MKIYSVKDVEGLFCLNCGMNDYPDYQTGKQAARETAIEWQYQISGWKYVDYFTMAEFNDFFCKLAKRYGLTREFKENGII